MIRYVKFNEESGRCTQIGEGTNIEKFKEFGLVEKDVEQSEVDGCWYLKDMCPHYTEEEKLNNAKAEKIAELKAKRDAELSATDFYLMPDYPISNEDLEKIKAYRQALRDLPQQEDFPYVEFPKNPLES